MKLSLLKIIKNIFFNIICLINLVLILLAFLWLFLISFIYKINNKNLYFYKNLIYYNFSKLLYISFFKRIKILNKQKIEIIPNFTILNSNHYHNIDWLILLNLLKNKDGYTITSISKNKDLSYFDELVLNILRPIILNDFNVNIELNNKLKNYKDKYLLCFFEGKALNHQRKNTYYKYTNQPKKILYNYFQNNYPNNYFYDINIVYTFKNKLLRNKDKFFLIKILHPYSKIYLQINKYKFGDNDIEDIYKIKNSQIEQIISKVTKH